VFSNGAQSALTVTSTAGTFGTPLLLTTGGGSGTGAVSFVAANGTATGCTVAGASLTTTSAGTCSVTATKAGDGTFGSESSVAATVTLARAQQAALTVTSTTGTFGTPLTLTTSGGSGTGPVTFVATTGTAGCAVTGSTLTTTSAGSCSATATKAGDVNFTATSSNPTTVSFATANQAALTVTSLNGTVGTPLTLTSSGGSGTGAITFVAANGTAGGCTVNGSALTVTGAGTCLVTATKAAETNYNAVSSAATAVTFSAAPVNRAPTDVALSNRSVAENQAVGTTVGMLSSTDADSGDTHTYSLVPGDGDADNGSFQINGSTLKTNATFDFETKSSYSLRVRSTDGGGQSFEKAFVVTVTDVVELPAGPVTLSMAASTATGSAPLAVTYTYTLVNGGSEVIFHTGVTDDRCGPVVLVSGDVDNDQLLDPGETWLFSCSQTLTATTTSTAQARGTSSQTGLAVTSNTDQVTVTVT